MRSLIYLTVLGLGGVVAAGCPGPGHQEQVEVGPPIPKDFTPPPALGAEPPVPDGLPGRAWLDAVHERFYGAWSEGFLEQCRVYLPPSHALNNSTLATTVELVVTDKGELSAVTVKTPSGNADFDAAALQVVRDAAPFPAPPAELLSDDGVFYVTWLFARDARQAGVAGARFDKRLWEPAKAVPEMLRAGRWLDAAGRLKAAADAGGDPASLVALARDLSTRLIELALADADSAGARADAVRAAGRAKLVALAPSLRELAKNSGDLAVREAALEALANMGDKDALPIFADAVAGLDGDRSAVAARAMGRLGAADQAWALVAPKLDDKDPGVRMAALTTVAELGAISSAPALIARLADKGAPRVERVAAARALGEVAAVAQAGGTDSAGATKALAAALLDGDAAVRAGATWAIARAGQAGYRSKGMFYKLEPLFKDKDPQVRAGAVVAGAAVEPKATGQSIAGIVRKDTNRVVLEASATALGGIPGPEALKLLLKLAQSNEAAVKLAALHALAHRSEPEAVSAVGALASSEDASLRLLAISAVNDTPSLEAAMTDPSLDVRAVALEKLMRASGAGGFLVRYLDLLAATAAPGERVRYAEAWLLATN